MPKPSVLQVILNKPSRSYAFPPAREYYSSKPELLRAATSTEEDAGVGRAGGYEPKNIPDIVIFGSSPRRGPFREDVTSTDASSRSRIASTSSHRPGTPSDPAFLQIHQSPSHRVINDDGTPEGHRDSDSDSENDVFYTPLSSPYNSPHTSMALSDTALVIPPAPISVPPKPNPPQSSLASFTFPRRALPSTPQTPSLSNGDASGRHSYTYSSSSSSDTEDDASIFSSSTNPMTASTHLTSPTQSVNDHRTHSLQRKGTISTTAGQSSATTLTVTNERTRERGHGHRRTQSVGAGMGPEVKDRRKAVYSSNDWAKDVRWLQPEGPSNGTVNLAAASGTRSTGTVPPSKGKGKVKDSSYSYYPWDQEERQRMSAVMEEDEDDLSSVGNRNSNYSSRSRRRLRVQSTPSTSQLRPPHSHTSHGSHSNSSASGGADIPRSQSHGRRSPSLASGSGSGHGHARAYSQSYTTRNLPTPMPASSSSTATHTYTGLVLPRAGQSLAPEKTLLGIRKKNKEYGGGGGKVDLTQSGMATTTMATVEVVKGVAGTLSKKRNIFKRNTSKDEGAFAHRHVSESETPLALTSHLSPPSYVPANSVLVQVWAAGLDVVDERLVREVVSDIAGGKAGKAVGYVPGRSLVGRAVEVGSSVREEVCRRNEWVVGMLDVRKCGALSEFVLLERHRIHRVPPPPPPGTDGNAILSRSSSYRSQHSRSDSQSPGGSRSSHARSQSLSSSRTLTNSRMPAPTMLSLEELALLPAVGVPAYRVLRTFERVIELRRVIGSEGNLARKRAFIIRGHDGVGAMVTQMLSKRGVDVTVFVPGGVIDLGLRDGGEGEVDLNEDVEERMRIVEKRIRAWGSSDIVWGSATRGDGRDREEILEAIQRLSEDGEEFDMVLDTIGGRDVWVACKNIMGGGSGLAAAQFTTTVGDLLERVVPTAQDHFWAGLRSMGLSRGGSVKKVPAGEKVAAALVNGSPSIKGSVKSKGKDSLREKGKEKKEVGYAWVSVSADVDMEGEDISDTLNAVLRMVKDLGIRPWAGPTDVDTYEETNNEDKKVLPFENAPDLFSSRSLLRDGGTAVVKIAA